MKTMFNSNINTRRLGVVLGLFLCASTALASQGGVKELLSSRFGHSERVSFVKVAVEGPSRQRIESELGRRLPRESYTVYVATTAGKVDGYALFDEERGQHEMISFATFFDAAGQVTSVEVVTYREAYGDGIKAERFRRQFVGRSARSGFRPDADIDAISGATISSRSMCRGVQRASLLVQELRQQPPTVLAAR